MTRRNELRDNALNYFLEHGLAELSLRPLAENIGTSARLLIYHFESKEALYRVVFDAAVADWFGRVESSVRGKADGWEKVDQVLDASFDFFTANPDFVRMVRREALATASPLGVNLGELLRPMLHRAMGFFGREMDAGRMRRYETDHLLLTGWGSVLSWFSDVPFLEALLETDPLSAETLDARRRHLKDFYRAALLP